MSRRAMTVADLARQAGMDLDEALVTLWDSGFEDLKDASEFVPGGSLRKAQRALGLASGREFSDPMHWRTILGIASEADWEALLHSLGISMPAGARRLPKGGPAKLRRHARMLDVPATVSMKTQPLPARPPARLPEPLRWHPVGIEREVAHISAAVINTIHEALVEEFAQTSDPFGDPHGVRDWHLLESSSFRPQTTLGGVRKYPTPEMAAAALLHSIVHNHPFHNGNKRTALVAMLVLLDEHDLVMVCHEDDVFRFVLRVAQHRLVSADADNRSDREVLEMARWIHCNSRRITRGERPVKWYQLRRILTAYGCELRQAAGVGNRMNVSRPVQRYGFLGRRKTVILRTQVAYGDEGREADRNTVHKVRTDLELTDAHGIDSEAFYGDAAAPRDFIFRYQKTLTRLARL